MVDITLLPFTRCSTIAVVTSSSTKVPQTSEKFAWGSRGAYCLQGYIAFHIPSGCSHSGVLLRLFIKLEGQDFLVTEVSCIRRRRLYTDVKTLSFLFSIKFTHNANALNKNMHVFWKTVNTQSNYVYFFKSIICYQRGGNYSELSQIWYPNINQFSSDVAFDRETCSS